jgi:hypothetical protein
MTSHSPRCPRPAPSSATSCWTKRPIPTGCARPPRAEACAGVPPASSPAPGRTSP